MPSLKEHLQTKVSPHKKRSDTMMRLTCVFLALFLANVESFSSGLNHARQPVQLLSTKAPVSAMQGVRKVTPMNEAAFVRRTEHTLNEAFTQFQAEHANQATSHESKKRTEAIVRGLLEARLAIEARIRARQARTKAKKMTQVANRSVLAAKLQFEVNDSSTLDEEEQEHHAEIMARGVFETRLAVEARERARMAEMEANRKAETASRSLSTARLEIKSRERSHTETLSERSRVLEANQRGILSEGLAAQGKVYAAKKAAKHAAKLEQAWRAVVVAQETEIPEVLQEPDVMVASETETLGSRQQPKSAAEEERLAAKYGAMELGDRAFNILLDLGMVQLTGTSVV